MNKLTEEEVLKNVREENPRTGVDAITRERLEKIDLDEVPEIIYEGAIIKSKEGQVLYKYDGFTPKVGSIFFKPSYGGSQILMGRVGRQLYFSNGQWFDLF